MALGLATGIGVAILPTRVAAIAGFAPAAVWCIGAQAAFVRGLWLPAANPVIALVVTTLSVLLFRYAVTDQQRRRIGPRQLHDPLGRDGLRFLRLNSSSIHCRGLLLLDEH